MGYFLGGRFKEGFRGYHELHHRILGGTKFHINFVGVVDLVIRDTSR